MRQVATLPAPVNVSLLRAALDVAGDDAQVDIEGVGTSKRLVILTPETPPAELPGA